MASNACTGGRTAGEPSGAASKAAEKPKRPSRARKAAAVAAVGRDSPASTSCLKKHAAAEGGHDAAAVLARLTAMHARFGGELSFLVAEFTKMEAQLSLEVGGASPVGGVCLFGLFLGFVSGGERKGGAGGRKNISEIVYVCAYTCDLLDPSSVERCFAPFTPRS